MLFTPKKKKRFSIRSILDKRNAFIKSENFSSTRALNFLNIAQFFGVVNDNVFKFLTVFLLIDIQGIAASSTILFWVGTVYVLPFLLFSSGAGVFADKFSKQKMIVVLKAIEVLTTALAVVAFSLESSWACYSLLFLLSFHSAAFGPPKYSIIPELVPPEKISKANGIITSFTYLGIIVGTFLASFITQVSSRNFTIASSTCVVIALLGFGASLFIPYTQPAKAKAKAKAKLFFLKEIYSTLTFCYHSPHLLSAILGAAFFLYLGAFFQLNIIPFAIQALGLSEVGGGYLFLTVAIGIAIGAVLTGKLSKHNVELGFSCVAGFFLFFLVLALAILPKVVSISVVLLILIGFFSGFFIVPFDAYIQKYSPDTKRGHVVATSNFMSFCGVLLAPISIYLFSGAGNLSAAGGFFIMSLLLLAISLLLVSRLSPIFFNWVGRIVLPKLYTISCPHIPFEESPVLILTNYSAKVLAILSGAHESICFFVLRNSLKPVDIFYKAFASIEIISLHSSRKTLHEYLIDKTDEGKICCLCLPPDCDTTSLASQIALAGTGPILYVHVEESLKERKKSLSLTFLHHL